jgi:ABC-type phosphate transport system auxiliary subunit
LRNFLCEAEVKELNWKQHMQSIEIHGAELERLREEVTRLTVAERDAQAKDQAREAAMNEATSTQNEMAELNMKLAAQEGEVKRTRKMFQSQIAALQEQLSELQEERLRPGANSNLTIESALAASRAKQAELQKQYDLLQRKYKTLQSSLLDMSATSNDASGTSPQDADYYLSMSASPVMMRARTHRVLSNAELEMNPYNVTPPLDPSSGAALTAVSSRQASPPDKEGRNGRDDAGPSRSPDQRHFGGTPRASSHKVPKRPYANLFNSRIA